MGSQNKASSSRKIHLGMGRLGRCHFGQQLVGRMGIVSLSVVNGCSHTYTDLMTVVMSGAGGIISSAADTVRRAYLGYA